MSKCLVIGAIAVVVIGVAAYVLSQPRKGTVEYHKREYLKAYKVVLGNPWRDQVRDAYHKATKGTPRPRIILSGKGEQIQIMQRHERWLVEAGYLKEQEWILTNQTPREVVRTFRKAFADDPFVTIDESGDRGIFLRAPASAFPAWEKVVLELDVPETK